MANLISISRRIKSAKNVSQITYAMQMVAASKMRKAQTAAISGRPYAQKISQAVSLFSAGVDRNLHPLLRINTSSHKVVILISTDKGLCGGLNTNLFKEVSRQFSPFSDVEFIALGKKAQAFAIKSKTQLTADFPLRNSSSVVPAVSRLITDFYSAGRAGEVYLAYNHFINALKQEPQIHRLLPLLPPVSPDKSAPREYTIEPTPAEVVDALLKAYLENQLRDGLHQAEASEYSARVVTMKAATDSARELISLLTLKYNQLRQEKITSEISDIVTARLAVK